MSRCAQNYPRYRSREVILGGCVAGANPFPERAVEGMPIPMAVIPATPSQ